MAGAGHGYNPNHLGFESFLAQIGRLGLTAEHIAALVHVTNETRKWS